MVFDALDSLSFPNSPITATTYGSGFDLKRGGTGVTQPMFVVVQFAGATASGASWVEFQVQTSIDNSAWKTSSVGEKDRVALATTPSGTVNVPILTEDRYIRLAAVFGGSGSGAAITVTSADLNISKL